MLQRWFAFGLCMALAQFISNSIRSGSGGFQLAPGEKLLAVNGVPVTSQPTSQSALSGSGVQQASLLTVWTHVERLPL